MVDLAVFAILMNGSQNFASGIGDFPARPFRKKKSRTILMNIIRTPHDEPARVFSFPKN
jgi:hypothetical protein